MDEALSDRPAMATGGANAEFSVRTAAHRSARQPTGRPFISSLISNARSSTGSCGDRRGTPSSDCHAGGPKPLDGKATHWIKADYATPLRVKGSGGNRGHGAIDAAPPFPGRRLL